MRKIWNNNVKKLFPFLALVLLVVSCESMDNYREEYVPDGEIIYTGKMDSVKVNSGHNRVVLQGLLVSDPKVTEVKVFWNSDKDSITQQVERSTGVDTITFNIDELDENVWNFIVYTYDEDGNSSVPVYAVGQSYGDSYMATLVNRRISSVAYADSVLTLSWGGVSGYVGIIGTEVDYLSTSGDTMTIFQDANSDADLLIRDFDANSVFEYRSLYIPDTTCVDTFYTAFDEQGI